MDRWVLRAALEILAEWQTDPALRDLRLSVNVSARHLTSSRLLPYIDSLVDEGYDMSRLMIEITETAAMEELDRAAEDLSRLRALGIMTALDDFGTGYASMTYLGSLPVDILKIDKTFLDDPRLNALVQLIVDCGHLLGMSITAEGVEEPTQVSWLESIGVDHLQGYVFGRPAPIEDFIPDAHYDLGVPHRSTTAPR